MKTTKKIMAAAALGVAGVAASAGVASAHTSDDIAYLGDQSGAVNVAGPLVNVDDSLNDVADLNDVSVTGIGATLDESPVAASVGALAEGVVSDTDNEDNSVPAQGGGLLGGLPFLSAR